MESPRNSLRRIVRYDETEFSNHSILHVMDKFVKSVNTMDETILVPCRLMDLKVGDENDPVIKDCSSRTVKELLRSADLYKVYNMIHDVKGDLVWGRESSISTGKRQGHVRRPSTASVASSSSLNSDSESDGGTETDSGIEEVQDVNYANRTELVTSDFRMHLAGLTNSLKQMTEAAQYLTSRYQHDIGGP
ncbi:mid1-interacting protein 1-B isoform X2 [Coccinella septempunctata]|uniref:mid1-interacting protein 1-B isoform X2 n=1 Tax=Coccinella septempunctata TaxID=41139 RepID=UPI001D08D555|nr:mid1-interacting protein 1-B isoform X2 [Coccinella septempunctata]